MFPYSLKMEVRPKRNKPFVCDECGEEIDTENDYNKIILVNFADGRKFRNKFCSLDCFEKWKLLKKPNETRETLEVEVKKMTDAEKEDYKEEEETNGTSKEVKKGKVSYKGESTTGKYKTDKEIKDIKEIRDNVECLRSTDSKGSFNIINLPGTYDRQGSILESPKYTPKEAMKKFVDYFNIFRIKHNRDKYK